MPQSPRPWEDFGFVAASSYRERVVTSLVGSAKRPKQIATETGLRIYHVSRALRELRDRDLVACLTPDAKGRGRLYSLTQSGASLLERVAESRNRFLPVPGPTPARAFAPKVRASTLLRIVARLKETKGQEELAKALSSWPVDLKDLDEDTWLPIEACAQFLDLVEQRFGDGSYAFIRSLFADAASSFPTIQQQLLRRLPLEELAERATVVYNREWNFGRLEVETATRRAVFSYFDWLPTPAMCALIQGVLEGILRARNVNGKVTKTQCVREGDPCCEYRVEW